MDTIRFEITRREAPAGDSIDAVEAIINDRDLADTLREVDSPRLIGEPATDYDREGPGGKIAVLGCVCGEPSCWPFLVEITFRDDVVVWSGFEQPHRTAWRYDELRPFVFDRTQYFSALDPGPESRATARARRT